MDIKIIKGLLDRYLNGSASPAEQKLIEQWLEENEFPDSEWTKMNDSDRLVWMNQLQDELNKTIENSNPTLSDDTSQVSLPWYRRMYFHLAAAVIVIAAVGSWYFFLNEKAPVQHVIAAAATNSTTDVLPGSNKAVLTLDNGATVVLDDSQNGVLAKQGNTEISKNGAQLVYNGNNALTGKTVSYNTLSTPRGGQYNLVLPDGSKVWLNAASSLRYPVVFAKDRREVEIKGEAYFEVAPQKQGNAAVPFIVQVNGAGGLQKGSIEVLGTHFNINAYDEEATVNTTLLEGKVKVLPPAKTGAKAAMLAPGQQSRLNAAGNIRVIPDADLEEAVAWKNGLFMMNSADIPVVLRQLGRWYDVEIVYNKDVPEGKISGDIPRNMKLSEVLKVMELSGVDFEIEGRKIIVEP